MNSYQYIVACGNPANGFTYYGPFVDAEAANEWADDELRNAGDWWVVTLEEAAVPDLPNHPGRERHVMTTATEAHRITDFYRDRAKFRKYSTAAQMVRNQALHGPRKAADYLVTIPTEVYGDLLELACEALRNRLESHQRTGSDSG